MNTYIKLENVAEGLNNNLDSGLKAETEQARKGNSIPWKLSLGGAFQTNSSLKLSGNECLPPDYLLARFLSILLSELYWQDIGDWQPGLCFPQASLSFPVAVYVAGSGMLNPIRDFFFLDAYTAYGNHAHLWCRKIPSVTFIYVYKVACPIGLTTSHVCPVEMEI